MTLVWIKWSGGERGVGDSAILTTYQLLPTPLVSDLSSVTFDLTAAGLNETGSLAVSELSPRYTEDLLMGRDRAIATGSKIPKDIQFFWEVAFLQAGGATRRRFQPAGAPNKDPSRFEWTIKLLKSNEDRARNGAIR